MKVLVTGGGGFLGRHIIDKLLENGITDIRVVARGNYPDLAECGIELFKADLKDKNSLITACQGIEAVFHVASKTGICGKFKDYEQTNIFGTRNLLQAAGLCGVRNFVYTSTPSVVYGREEIINGDETLPFPDNYLTHYAATKAQAEKIVLSYDGRAGLRTCALRPHLIFGPGDTNLIPRILQRARKGKLIRIGDGCNLISVSYVENVADAHICALNRLSDNDKGVRANAFFINETEPVNCWEFIGKILQRCHAPAIRSSITGRTAYRLGSFMELVGAAVAPNWEPPMTRFLALQLSTSHYFNTDKASKLLGWKPRVEPEESLSRLAAAFDANPQ